MFNRLPHLGDRPDLKLSPTNPAAFAHLGAELKMKDYPQASNVTGNLFSNDTVVEIRSAFTRAEVLAARNQIIATPAERRRETLGIWAESIPLIGRFVAHDTGEHLRHPCGVTRLSKLNSPCLLVLYWVQCSCILRSYKLLTCLFRIRIKSIVLHLAPSGG
jgi:hypothetical protein